MQTNNRRNLWKRSDGKIKRNKKSRRRSRNSGGGRMSLYYNAGRQALRDINMLRKFINTEVKCVDVTGSEASSTTPTFDLLNGMALGNANGQRSGQSVKCQNVDLKILLTISASAATSFERVMVVQDKQCNGAIFAIGSLLNGTNTYSSYVVGGQNRFLVLFDETFALSANGDQVFTKSIRLGTMMHVEYNTGNAGTVADINTNSLYLIHLSDQVTNTVNMQYFSRFWYVDN